MGGSWVMNNDGKYYIHFIHGDATMHSENRRTWRDVESSLKKTFKNQDAVRAVVYESTPKYGTTRIAEYSWTEFMPRIKEK